MKQTESIDEKIYNDLEEAMFSSSSSDEDDTQNVRVPSPNSLSPHVSEQRKRGGDSSGSEEEKGPSYQGSNNPSYFALNRSPPGDKMTLSHVNALTTQPENEDNDEVYDEPYDASAVSEQGSGRSGKTSTSDDYDKPYDASSSASPSVESSKGMEAVSNTNNGRSLSEAAQQGEPEDHQKVHNDEVHFFCSSKLMLLPYQTKKCRTKVTKFNEDDENFVQTKILP